VCPQYVVKEVALYPNSVSVPLMANYGVPHQPKGMVHITLHSITGLKSTDMLTKGDPYVEFEVSSVETVQQKPPARDPPFLAEGFWRTAGI
jgi:hypothetical protein